MGPAAGAKFKKRVTVFDEENRIYRYEHVNDPRYSKFQVTMRFSPGPDRSTTTLDWKVEYEPIDPSTVAPGKVKQVAMKVCDAIQHYSTEHPNWPWIFSVLLNIIELEVVMKIRSVVRFLQKLQARYSRAVRLCIHIEYNHSSEGLGRRMYSYTLDININFSGIYARNFRVSVMSYIFVMVPNIMYLCRSWSVVLILKLFETLNSHLEVSKSRFILSLNFFLQQSQTQQRAVWNDVCNDLSNAMSFF